MELRRFDDGPRRRETAPLDQLDPVGIYLRELRQVRRLTRKEEAVIVHRYRQGTLAHERMVAGDSDPDLYLIVRQGDVARNVLIESHLPLVLAIAKRVYDWSDGRTSFADLVCAGNEGLVAAVPGFDPSRGNRFSTYALWHIRERIAGALRHERWHIHLSDKAYRSILRLAKSIRMFTAELGRQPNIDELAEFTGWSAGKVQEVAGWSRSDVVTLNAKVGTDHTGDLANFIADESATVGDEPCLVGGPDREMQEVRRLMASALTKQERQILSLRYGLNNAQPLTLMQTGNRAGISRERVRQIEIEAIYKIRRASGVSLS